ncbi:MULTISPECIES: GntR family transcriptional regulator [unclassified Cryobacterium]|uniref:GntR family transcriptional regulator n=1 Tax=unclassified Cryobacterium TaxID=2649013 RepID=UPI00106C119D|nr:MULTISPECIES: GntR family transcriptional regulator [unclassified Cryobacterium]TFB95197.1 GntR family transcriptional regulator [Cryobacterium sp. MDB2-A-1]TFC11232.1 GntR family transcriptional regulator [Cryobacterium sp. MDB2-A-2]TFC11528.1 GntR family transcriptional regulator [Cryobacterium sp. MDB2-33-2]TFC17525.1 GntR family transcriptional regulator [Cryobacterium sp. MDB2-10]TFC25841.1 GntR family transcriptional regulator [Cryobacterium sp. MDB1-18-2]
MPNESASLMPAGASAVERAYTHVADLIISGSLPASSFLTEGEIAGALSLSRTPVREAFLALEARGLIRLFPKKGAVVTALDEAETAELLQVRIMLETTAVRLLGECEGGTGAVDTDLAALIEIQADAAASGDLLTFARADHRFHSRIVDENRNRVIDGFYAQLGPRLERLTHRVASRDPRNLERLLAEHRTLAGHVSSGDTAAYDRALREHVEAGHFSTRVA